MARMGFIQGRPLRAVLEDVDQTPSITKRERPALIECLMDLWTTVETYLFHLWKLRGSITAAPIEVQRTLRTHVATPRDLQDLIRNPYSTRSQRNRKNHWLSSLAKFCKRRQLTPISEEPLSAEPALNAQAPSRWNPEWTRWLSRHSRFGAANSASRKGKATRPKRTKSTTKRTKSTTRRSPRRQGVDTDPL